MSLNHKILVFLCSLVSMTLYGQGDSTRFWVKNPFWERLFNSYPAEIQEKSVAIRVYPEINQIYAGPDDWWRNGRGISIEASNERFSLRSSFLEQQDTRPPTFLQSILNPQMAVPGFGRWKTFKETGYDYTRIQTDIEIKVHKNWQLSGGYTQNRYLPFANLQHSFNLFSYPTISSELTFARTRKGHRFILVNGYSQWSDFIRLPKTLSGEAPFYSRLMNNAGIEFISESGFSVYIGSLVVSERYGLGGSQRQRPVMAFQPMPIIPGLFGSSSRLDSYANSARISYKSPSQDYVFTCSAEAFVRDFEWLSGAVSVSFSGKLLALRHNRDVNFSLKSHYWQRANGAQLNALFGYQILHAQLSNAQTMVAAELSAMRILLGTRLNRLAGYQLNVEQNAMNSVDTYLGLTINPSYNFKLKLGRISHSEYVQDGFFYVSLSTNFAPNYLDY